MTTMIIGLDIYVMSMVFRVIDGYPINISYIDKLLNYDLSGLLSCSGHICGSEWCS